mgnify:CR=1 FL=1
MERVKWIDHKGKKILLGDLSKAMPEEWPEIDKQYDQCFKGMPEGSVRSLICVEDAHFNADILLKLKERAKQDTPLVKKTAFVGITGLKKAVLGNLLRFAGRKAEIFEDREKAKDWLAED